MLEFKEGLREGWLELFFEEINRTTMKRDDFARFKRAYESRQVVLSLWEGEQLVAFGSMLTDWTMNSIIYDVVVVERFQKQGHGRRIMEGLMGKAPGTRFYLTSTFGNEEFYRKLGYRKHRTAFALYEGDSPYLE